MFIIFSLQLSRVTIFIIIILIIIINIIMILYAISPQPFLQTPNISEILWIKLSVSGEQFPHSSLDKEDRFDLGRVAWWICTLTQTHTAAVHITVLLVCSPSTSGFFSPNSHPRRWTVVIINPLQTVEGRKGAIKHKGMKDAGRLHFCPAHKSARCFFFFFLPLCVKDGTHTITTRYLTNIGWLLWTICKILGKWKGK